MGMVEEWSFSAIVLVESFSKPCSRTTPRAALMMSSALCSLFGGMETSLSLWSCCKIPLKSCKSGPNADLNYPYHSFTQSIHLRPRFATNFHKACFITWFIIFLTIYNRHYINQKIIFICFYVRRLLTLSRILIAATAMKFKPGEERERRPESSNPGRMVLELT